MVAVDGGGVGDEPPREAEVSVTVRLEDINDNVPKFERDSYSIEFSEDAKIGKDGDTNSGNFTHPPTPCPPLVLFIIKLVQTGSGQYLPEGTN